MKFDVLTHQSLGSEVPKLPPEGMLEWRLITRRREEKTIAVINIETPGRLEDKRVALQPNCFLV